MQTTFQRRKFLGVAGSISDPSRGVAWHVLDISWVLSSEMWV